MTPSPMQPHDGGPMPVAADRYVGIAFRSGVSVLIDRAGAYVWAWDADPRKGQSDIVAFCEWMA